MLVLLACEAVGGKRKQALNAAVAIEMLHNFTLVHDDVMDNATLRRNRRTVHVKWDANVAILAGDEMIALAYQSLLKTKTKALHEILHLFTDAFIEVCEGQGFDKEFESRRNVRVEEYLLMIRKKTARIIASAAEIGALIGGGDRRQVSALRMFGTHLGMAFQIKDDLLDLTGTAEEFGKVIGGDIVEGKKTYLLLKAVERTGGDDKAFLRTLMARNGKRNVDLDRVKNIYERTGILEAAEAEIGRCTRAAQRELTLLPSSRSRRMLLRLSDQLLERTH
jgi:geranylgeranyl diphosphate synthase type II